MTHRTVHEWGRVAVGEGGFTRVEANALLKAARGHPCAHADAANILIDRHDHLRTRQVVGMLAGKGCSLEILPKVDPDVPEETDEGQDAVRKRLVQMLDTALDLGISTGTAAEMSRQGEALLDILIRHFAENLLEEVRRGLPRRYLSRDDDLPALRGRLDLVRQFTVHAVRPDRLACHFDSLEADTPLVRIMAACVRALSRYARRLDTQRKLVELRHLLADIPEVPVTRLPWQAVRIDRTNRRWGNLFRMARLLLRRDWQATHHHGAAPEGLTLLFPMNDLFEAYVAALLRRAVVGTGVEVITQGGLRHCLGDWRDGEECKGQLFQTKPDIILRLSGGGIRTIIDTKWKKLAVDPLDAKHGVSQADVYQLMAYARLYQCDDLMLLYPAVPNAGPVADCRKSFGIAGGRERLQIATIDVARGRQEVIQGLAELVRKYDWLTGVSSNMAAAV